MHFNSQKWRGIYLPTISFSITNLIMPFFPSFCYHIVLKSKYLPSAPYSRSAPTCVLPSIWRTGLYIRVKQRVDFFSFLKLKLHILHTGDVQTTDFSLNHSTHSPYFFPPLNFSCIKFWIMILSKILTFATFSNIYYHSLLWFCTASCWRHMNISTYAHALQHSLKDQSPYGK